MAKGTRAHNYAELDRLFSTMEKLASNFSMSQTIRDYLSGQFVSFFYASLISGIFDNINKAKSGKHSLSTEERTAINRSYIEIRRKSKAGLSLSLKQHELIDETYYENFKTDLIKQHSSCFQIVISIEKEIDMNRARKYLMDRQNNLKSAGKPDTNLQTVLLTKEFEKYIQSKNRIPMGSEYDRLLKSTFSKKSLNSHAENIYKYLKKSSNQILEEQKTRLSQFEKSLYNRWSEPLDLLQGLITISFESGVAKKNKILKTENRSNKYKHGALVRIHARGILMSREIFTLLKGGYADGANARLRSLHELAVIASFLYENDNKVARRFLDYTVMKAWREAQDYQMYANKLGYTPFSMKEMKAMEKNCKKLEQRYGQDYGKRDYNWIPETILSDRNFKALAQHVKLDHLRPYYHMSSDAVHGGSPALFFQLGLMDYQQGKTLLVTPTMYGLADPLQGTAISLMHISYSLLRINSDLEDTITMYVIGKYVDEIGLLAVSVQKR